MTSSGQESRDRSDHALSDLSARSLDPEPGTLFVIDGGADALNHRHASMAATSVLDAYGMAAYSGARSGAEFTVSRFGREISACWSRRDAVSQQCGAEFRYPQRAVGP